MKEPTISERSGFAARRLARACVATSAVLLASCAVGPEYARPAVDVPAAWSSELSGTPAVLDTPWWREFGDAKLAALVDTALASNKDLMLATLRIEQFEAKLQISEAARYPEVGYAASGQRERRSEERPNGLRPGASASLNNFEISGNVTWELDLWGRVRRASEAARAELLASREVRHGVMLTLATDVISGYVRLLELDARLALVKDGLANGQRALALSEQRLAGGSGTRIDVERERARIEAQAADVPRLEQDIATLEFALSGLLGLNPGPIERGTLDALKVPMMPGGLPVDVLGRRPDIMAAEQNLIAANARIGVAKTRHLPVLSLNAILGLAADDLRWLLAETAGAGNFGAGLAGTIFSGGRIEAQVREAEVAHKEMAVRYQQAIQTALVEVETALRSHTKSGERQASFARSVAIHENVLRLAGLRQEGGQASLRDVLQAESRLLEARALQAQGTRDTLLSLVSLYRALGGGWMSERPVDGHTATAALQMSRPEGADAETTR